MQDENTNDGIGQEERNVVGLGVHPREYLLDSGADLCGIRQVRFDSAGLDRTGRERLDRQGLDRGARATPTRRGNISGGYLTSGERMGRHIQPLRKAANGFTPIDSLANSLSGYHER